MLPDANVLWGRTSRDWLCLLRDACNDLFQLYYTEDILAETIARIRDSRSDLTGGQITRIADLLRTAMVRLDDFASDRASYPGTDEGDLHVHSAAQSPMIGSLITYDTGFLELTDMQKATLSYEILAPDDFFVLIQESDPRAVRNVTGEQFEYWMRRGHSRPDLPGRLADSGCPRFAVLVQQHLEDLQF